MIKGLEALIKLTNGLTDNEEWYECYNTIEKELKALEIIKNKPNGAANFLMILKSRFDHLSYKNYTDLFLTDLTQEEYDLLKEVLNYEQIIIK